MPAREALQQQRWAEAVPELQAQLEQGQDSAELLYNLGLCYHHLNDLGRARAYYQASLFRNPWNSDLHSNLAVLKATLNETEPEETWTQTLSHLAPPWFLASLMILTSWSACALAWSYLRRPRELWLWSAVASGVVAVLSTTLWTAHRLQPQWAAVIPETAQLTNGPGGEFSQSLPLHAGNLVEVVRLQGDWVEVEALGKVRAWIRRDELQWVP